MKKIELPIGGIIVYVLSDHEGFIRSKLKLDPVKTPGSALDITDYNQSIEMLEMIVLEHAKSGVNIQDARYITGLESALEKLSRTL